MLVATVTLATLKRPSFHVFTFDALKSLHSLCLPFFISSLISLNSQMGSLPTQQQQQVHHTKSPMWIFPQISGFNPPQRWGHSSCFSHGVVYVFGGCCGGMHFSDVLMLNLDTMVWKTLATTGEGPGPRDSHSAVLVGQKMIVFGGTNGAKKVNDLHILDLATKEWIHPQCGGSPPSPRESHSATLVGDDKMVIFGGSGEGEANYLNDLHVLELKTMRWTSPVVKGNVPVPRDSHSSNVVGNRLFVYGGDCGDRYHGDVDVLDLETLTWWKMVVQGSSPGVRAGHAAVNIGTKVYVIGGVGDKSYYNDIWILDVVSPSWTQLDVLGQKPQGRFSHTAVVTDSDIAIYGGCGEDERPLNELLILQIGPADPNAGYNISMCKIFGNHWKKKRSPAEDNSAIMFLQNNDLSRKVPHELDSEPTQSLRYSSDNLQMKKRKASSSNNIWEIESEQEEQSHSHSLSQHSSPSQSDNQDQTPITKPSEPAREFQLLNRTPPHFHPNTLALRNSIRKSPYNQQFPETKPMEFVFTQNLIGAEVRGKVDGAFDSGFLMTATVNGKIFRGVLFPPNQNQVPGISPRAAIQPQSPSPTSHIAVPQPFSNTNHIESPFKSSSQQPVRLTMPESSQAYRPAQVNRHFPVFRGTTHQEVKSKSDLQGVVLTLGGPGTGGS